MTTSAICNSYKLELLNGVHSGSDVYKIALIKANPDQAYGASVTNVGSPGLGVPAFDNLGTDEVSPSGTYSSGGGVLDGFATSLQGTVAVLDFNSVSFANATISASGALIYNSSKSNRAVAIVDFGATVSSTSGAFAINAPAVGAATSLIRLG